MVDYSDIYSHHKKLIEESQLSRSALFLLIRYTLFFLKDTDKAPARRKVFMTIPEGTQTFQEAFAEISPLGFMTTTGYGYSIQGYEFNIANHNLIPLMLYFFVEHKGMVSKVLDDSKSLSPSPIQELLWKYIINNGNIPHDLYAIAGQKEYKTALLPAVTVPFFSLLFENIDSAILYDIIQERLRRALEECECINVDILRDIITGTKSRKMETRMMKDRLLCTCDLINYLAYGKRATNLSVSNKNHRIIAAIHEAYHGNIDNALEHFKCAVRLNNKDNPRGYATSMSYLPSGICNFFLMLVAYLSQTDEGTKKCNAIYKANERRTTQAAKVLYEILFSLTNGEEKNRLASLASNSQSDRTMAKLMLEYLGITSKDAKTQNTIPKWLILKHEMRKYLPLSDEDRKKADAVFGESGLLSSIYHRKEWEIVLDDLMGRKDATTASQKKTSRLVYVLRDMTSNLVDIRLQTILKSGAWSSGREVSKSNFINCNVDDMSSADIAIAKAEYSSNRHYYSYDIDIHLSTVLKYMDENTHVFVGVYAPLIEVELTEESPYITMQRSDDGFDIISNVPESETEKDIIITHRGAATLNFLRLSKEQKRHYSSLLKLGRFPLEAEEQLRDFLKHIGAQRFADGSTLEVNCDLIEGGSTLKLTEGNPQLVIQMRPNDKESYAVSVFCRPLNGGKTRCIPGEGDSIIIDTNEEGRVRVTRNLEEERTNLNHFIDSISEEVEDITAFTSYKTVTIIPFYDLLPVIEYAKQNAERISCEWPEGSEMRIKNRQSTSAWTGAIKKNENGWFEIEGSVEIDQDQVLTMAQLLDLVAAARGRYIKLAEGEFMAISDKLRKQLNQLNAVASRSHGKLQMSPFSAAIIGSDMFDGELFLEEDEELKEIRERIAASSKYSPRVPKTLNATLRKYQKQGFQWMSRLNKWGAGALLADDMGLGKTIQTITFLLSKADEGPGLVVAPASVAPNWKNEFEKFAPTLNIQMLNFAEDRAKTIEDAKAGDIIVTTYGLLLSVKDDITKKQWTTICLDEAHIIKNRGAKTSAVAMQLKSEYRIMLTGTPVQNHLGELWNLFQFVNPGLLGSFEDFNRRFIIPIEQNKNKDTQKQLDRLVKPFMLRRTKEKVAKELPEKEEIYQHVEISEDEMLVYEALRQKAEALLLAEGSGKVSMNTLAEITRLRQCACDIRLTKEGKKGNKDKVGSKITALTELLSTIVEGNGHALVFSQFTSYLALIKKELDKEKIPYLYIDGSVEIKTRTKLVDEFQEGKTPVFLISLKAGGLGLNLTRANYVIHMDPWWNPAIEAQATDRAHRIGQKNAVTVYHLISEGTIEEKIQRLHEQKQELVDNILDSTDTSHKLTGEQLLEMVRG